MLELFTLPFMQKAFLAGGILGLVIPFLGVYATLRRMSFFSDGVAHASLAGVALGIITGLAPFPAALLIGICFGLGVYFLQEKSRLATDAVIGVIFTAGLAFGVVVMSLQEGYQPELLSFLFGNILAMSWLDVGIILGLSAIILLFLVSYLRQLALMSLDKELAWVQGVATRILDPIFYVVLSLTVVLGVKLLGVILVSALLITPATTAKLLARSFREQVILAMVAGEIALFGGLIVSYYLDLPSGATIILFSTLIFLLVLALRPFLADN